MNNALTDDPALVNSSAEADGWMAKMKLSNPSELDSLMVRHVRTSPTGGSAPRVPSRCPRVSHHAALTSRIRVVPGADRPSRCSCSLQDEAAYKEFCAE